MSANRRAALGFKVHTGWAAAVAIAGPAEAPEVVGKRRIEMATTFDEGAVFHAGQELPFAKAEALVRTSEARFQRVARIAVAAFVEELRAQGCEVVASAVVAGSAKPLPPLETILKSHPLVHAAEGELYRRVVADASAACRLATVLVPGKELAARAARARHLSEPGLATRLAAMGKASGKPWAADQKEAALAAWIALTGAPA